MYGIILDSMTDCIKQLYGEETWKRVVGSADISNTVFTTHKIYDEQLIPMIAKAAGEITGNNINTIMEQAGRHFIVYIDDIKNDRIAKVLGRTFKDFLNGLDCMHEYYRFSFPELQPPSFYVASEDSAGLELHYRSKRTFTGFMFYVKGILYEIAKNFFNMDIDVQIVQHGFNGDVLCAIFRLDYRNDEYTRIQDLIKAKRQFREQNNLSFPSHVFFELFPFHVVFDERLVILSTGNGLDELYSGLEGKRINETFFLTRPLGYDLTWENVLIHGNNVFELTSVKAAGRRGKTDDTSRFRHQMAATHFIKLRGQMLYVEEWNFVIFLSTLMLDDLNTMYEMGIFVNDLTFHDLSRDMVLHGPQQTTEYKLALDLEQGKTARLEEMIETLDAERRKTDDLLYSRIPKEIARSLRQGNTTVSLCEKYDDVTVLFSDIVNFASICMHIAPHEIMIILNMMVSVFDILCNKFEIYKVETVADGFMAVSGVPTYNEHHAKNMADMAFEMLNGIKTVKDPNTRASIHIRIGLHCGYVIAGLVGHKIPRYCLFGDTVNIASKMEATGEGQRIQISQTCMENLSQYGNKYVVETKGSVKIKGCGNIMTYWLIGMNEDDNSPLGEEIKLSNDEKRRSGKNNSDKEDDDVDDDAESEEEEDKESDMGMDSTKRNSDEELSVYNQQEGNGKNESKCENVRCESPNENESYCDFNKNREERNGSRRSSRSGCPEMISRETSFEVEEAVNQKSSISRSNNKSERGEDRTSRADRNLLSKTEINTSITAPVQQMHEKSEAETSGPSSAEKTEKSDKMPKAPEKNKSPADDAYNNLLRVIDKFEQDSNDSFQEETNIHKITKRNFGKRALKVEKQIMESLLENAVDKPVKPISTVIKEVCASEKNAAGLSIIAKKGPEEANTLQIGDIGSMSEYWQPPNIVGSGETSENSIAPQIIISQNATGSIESADMQRLDVPSKILNKRKILKSPPEEKPKIVFSKVAPTLKTFLPPSPNASIERIRRLPDNAVSREQQRTNAPTRIRPRQPIEVRGKSDRPRACPFDAEFERRRRKERKEAKREIRELLPKVQVQVSKACSIM